MLKYEWIQEGKEPLGSQCPLGHCPGLENLKEGRFVRISPLYPHERKNLIFLRKIEHIQPVLGLDLMASSD